VPQQQPEGIPVSEQSAATAAHGATPARTGVRPEIQALRTVAVLSVVIYHLWPERLTGGFVGVDIFFAISGFLITAHLIREVDRTGRVRLAQFWARRARRLLPASLLVLVASALMVWAFIPQTYWQQFFTEIRAAALYVENWQLAGDAVDYLAADNIASPVQHFWSLSTEEQFYLVWPVLVLVAVLLSGKLASPARRRVFIGSALGVVAIASLVFSILWTNSNAASAYFITPTRAWEFAAGGLLGVFSLQVVRSESVRTVVSWLGWATILVSVLVYSVALPFPGYIAAIPVLGTLAVIWAGSPTTRWSATWLASRAPVQFLGDISYSLYLWHWPLIIVMPFILGHDIGWRTKIAIFSVALLLAWLTKLFVEDPVRSKGFFAARGPAVTFAGMIAAVAIVVAGTTGGYAYVQQQVDATAAEAKEIANGDVSCFGAAGFDTSCVDPRLDGVLVPEPVPLEDRSKAFIDGCVGNDQVSDLIPCTYGSTEPDAKVVALVGDSHAAMWLPALEQIATTKNWRIELFVKNGCAYTAAKLEKDNQRYGVCETWKGHVDVALAELPDLAIMFTSYRSNILKESEKKVASGFEKKWQPIVDRGVKVYAIADIPQMLADGVLCVATNQESGDYSSCDVPRDEAFADVVDAQKRAADAVGAGYISLNPYLCDADTCFMVIGHVMVYYDRFHVTATYARTVGPYLQKAISKAK